MKRRGIGGFLLGAVSVMLVFALVTPTSAATLGEKSIKVQTGVEIYVDGIEMRPTDVNGKAVETFIYNGTTYVPLRAVSQSLGKSVDWDGANNRVYIGERPGEKQYLLNVCPPYQSRFCKTPTTIAMMGNKYANGCYMCGNYTSSDGWALFNLDAKYSTLSFDMGHIDGNIMEETTINFYLDGELSFSLDLKPEMLVEHYDIPLHNALQLKIETDYYGGYYALANVEIN